ncbi:SGNH/GDSL hydrolase family protein [Roseibium salinum]|uniref:SGNH/GDSL hydrolase family protein n=1 Tax=Roseibium salinum TaxID=1604349 RepID=A0ABT3R5U7_9HYPH|nr:SGNH/GDSL hydrolase family protein [Roseibium sp. DSM 29163]MCX2724620.1 SGNH/GDSL hydrolase family protein [Roseibium sp. DSM 29163]
MKTVLCYGDSNTYGSSPMKPDGSWFRYGPDIRWPRRLASLLGPDWHVIEEGLPGRTTCHDNPFDGPHKNGLRHLPVALESHAPIDLIIVMLGTNDLKAFLGLTPPDIAKGLRSLLLQIRRSEASPDKGAPDVLVVAPVPIEECGPTAESLAGGAAKSRALASLFASLAEEFGARFFDAGSVATVSAEDGVHLTAEAHIAIADTIASRF